MSIKNSLIASLFLTISLQCYGDKTACLSANSQIDPKAPEICQEALETPGLSADDKSKIYITHAAYLISNYKFNEANQTLDLAFNSNPKMLENGIYRYNWLRTKGKLYFSKEEFMKALPFFVNSNEVAKIMEVKQKIATSYNDIGATYLELNEYSQALVWLQKSLDIYNSENDNELIALSLANIAEVYLAISDYENAKVNFLSSETILKKVIQKNSDEIERYEIPLAKVYLSTANLYKIQSLYDDADMYLQEALALYEKYQLTGEQVKVLSTLGELYLKQSKIDQSLQTLIKAQTLENTLESQDNLELKLNLTHAYISNNDWEKAEFNALKGLNQSKITQDTLQQAHFLEALASIYQNTSQLNKSIEYYKLLEQLNKQNYENRYNLSHAKLLKEIESTKEQREVLKLEKQRSIQKLKISNQRFMFLLIALVLFGLIAYLLFLLNRKGKIKKQEQSDQAEHHNQLSLLSIKKEKIEQLFHGMVCRIICFDSVGLIHYRSSHEESINSNCFKMQDAYKDIWTLILPFLKESDKINKDLLLKNYTINNNIENIWIHQMEFLDDLLVCLIFDDKKKTKELNYVENIRQYSQLMQRLSHFYIHNKNIPISNTKQLKNVLASLQSINEINTQFSTNENVDHKGDLKVLLVDMMITSIDVWQTSTGKSSLELAEESGFWLVSIEDGQLRTRTMNKYSDIKKIPNKPRWRQVVKTAHFILSNCELKTTDRKSLNEKINTIKNLMKNQAIGN